MRFISFLRDNVAGIAAESTPGTFNGMCRSDAAFPGSLTDLLRAGQHALQAAADLLAECGKPICMTECTMLPPIMGPQKITRVCPSYADTSNETGLEKPACASLSSCSQSRLTGHASLIQMPEQEGPLDCKGELVAVIGRRGARIPATSALAYVAGYTIYSEATFLSDRDYTAQWTTESSFKGTGALGPTFVTADELPRGASGLRIQTRLNGVLLHEGNTDQMVFDVATVIALVSDAMTLEPGDLIVIGQASRVGTERVASPPAKAGDVYEVKIDQIGVLRTAIGTGHLLIDQITSSPALNH